MQILNKTESICPACYYEGILKKIDANIIEDDEKIWILRVCHKHGPFKDIIFGDVNLYKRWIKFKITGMPVSYVKTNLFSDSVLYTEHLSQTMLTNLIVTNRYNLKSNQNFFDANITGYVYEPSLDQLRDFIQQVKTVKPLGLKAIQIAGGEPTLRDDLLEIIRIAKETGFSHVQINTNGIKLAESVDYCQSLKNEKVDTIYLNFSGIKKTTNPLIESHKKVIENCKKVNLNIILVPTIIADENLCEAGKIVRFAIENCDSIKGVHFQLFASDVLASKVTECEKEKQHLDYGKLFQFIEQEFPGRISRDDFYPYCFIFPISKFVQIITNDTQAEVTAHPSCGGSTFIFIENGKPLPMTRFIDVETFMRFLTDQSKKKGPLRKLRIASAFMKYIDTFVDFKKAPNGFNPKQILKDATIFGSEYALREFRNKTLIVGFMGYQNVWNLDIDRLKRCVIHCPTFDGTVPFCSYHALGYGDKILKQHSISIQEWEKTTGRSIKDDLHQHE
jgi:7,8-dihydro-6-hydroxymethylpterin dimethyltransferase